ncbi:hypothetical protein HJFPF1_07460 [Paramyrothecium foliicola]|nr:hypothetical protein HJFPF1_07460 [Paramyrothecium foliicola]
MVALNMASLTQMPLDVVNLICDLLPNEDLRNVRYTCSALSTAGNLKIERVFLSSDPRNISINAQIAGNKLLRAHISEIALSGEDDPDESAWKSNSPPRWFVWYHKQEIRALRSLGGKERIEAGFPAPLRDTWAYIKSQEIEKTDYDGQMAQFDQYLAYLPTLRKITFFPAYGESAESSSTERVTIEAIPMGALYPCPGWKSARARGVASYKMMKYLVALLGALAARKDAQLEELKFLSHTLGVGITFEIFEPVHQSLLQNLEYVVSQPSFRHLHIDFFQDEYRGAPAWSAFVNGALAGLLGKAGGGRGLEQLTLRLTSEPRMPFRPEDICIKPWLTLPSDCLKNIKHLHLSGFCAQAPDLGHWLRTVHWLRSPYPNFKWRGPGTEFTAKGWAKVAGGFIRFDDFTMRRQDYAMPA